MKTKFFRSLCVVYAVFKTVRREGDFARTDFPDRTVVVVKCMPLENIVGFAVADVFVVAQGGTGRDGYFRIKVRICRSVLPYPINA